MRITGFLAVALLAGCANPPANKLLSSDGGVQVLKTLMARQDTIVHLSPPLTQVGKPVLLLLHGATDDPTEMMTIVREWRGKYDVFLYSYDYHRRIEKVASDFVGEMKRLKTENNLGGSVTVLVYSYAAIVFRMAVIVADDRSLFSNVSLIQLAPTAGGSSLARSMWFPGIDTLVSLASKPSAAVNPYGRVAKELWEGEGNRKFYEAINPERTISILLEGDSYSLAGVRNKKVQRRYQNGIGPNVIVIPKSAGVTHEYFPTERAGLDYLRRALERCQDTTKAIGMQFADPDPSRKPRAVVFRLAPSPGPGF
jgi:hypothetical protein